MADDDEAGVTISQAHYLHLVEMAANSVKEQAAGSSRDSQLAWEVHKNLTVQLERGGEWAFMPDIPRDEIDEDEQLARAMAASLGYYE